MTRKKKNILLLTTLVIVLSLYICDVKLTNGKVEYLGDNLKVLNENVNNYFDEVISKTVMDDNHTFNMTYISPINVERTYYGSLITWPSVNDSQGHQITYRLSYTGAKVVSGEELVYIHITNTTDNNYLWNYNSQELIVIRIEAKCEYGLSISGRSDALSIRDDHYLTFPSIHLPIKYSIPNESMTLEWSESIDSYGFPVFYEVYISVGTQTGGPQMRWILIETNITRTSFTINITKFSNGEYNNDPPEISEDARCYLRVNAISKISVHSIVDFPDEMKEFLTSKLGEKLQQEQEITPGWSNIITIFSVVIVIIISRIINIQNRRKLN